MYATGFAGFKVTLLIASPIVDVKGQKIILHKDKVTEDEGSSSIAFPEGMNGKEFIHHFTGVGIDFVIVLMAQILVALWRQSLL